MPVMGGGPELRMGLGRPWAFDLRRAMISIYEPIQQVGLQLELGLRAPPPSFKCLVVCFHSPRNSCDIEHLPFFPVSPSDAMVGYLQRLLR